MTAVAALPGVLLALGIVLLVSGFRGTAEPTGTRVGIAGRWARLTRRPAGKAGRTRDLRLLVGLVVGLIAFALSGWLVLVVAIPVAAVGLPYLLGDPPNRDIALLGALDRWVRSLAATIPTGQSITDAIRVSRRHAPELLAEPVALVTARLEDRWSTRSALQELADTLDSPDADAVIAALMLASDRGGVGAAQTLTTLSDSIQERLRALRDIEAERAKPRVVVRQVTAITMVVLTLALLTNPSYFDPYRAPVGQGILAVLVSAYLASLLFLRRMTAPRPRERILQLGERR